MKSKRTVRRKSFAILKTDFYDRKTLSLFINFAKFRVLKLDKRKTRRICRKMSKQSSFKFSFKLEEKNE